MSIHPTLQAYRGLSNSSQRESEASLLLEQTQEEGAGSCPPFQSGSVLKALGCKGVRNQNLRELLEMCEQTPSRENLEAGLNLNAYVVQTHLLLRSLYFRGILQC